MSDRTKNDGKAVADSPIADVFQDDRHPSASEKQWAEKTLAPSLEHGPEKAIGAATGTNVDEHGNARFTTISGLPIRRLYTPADLPADWDYDQIPELSRTAAIHARHSRLGLSRQDVDHAPVLGLRLARGNQPALQVSAVARRPRSFGRLRSADAHGLRQRSSVQRRRSRQVRRRHRLARRHGDPVRRHRPGEDHRLDDHQLAGVDPVGDVPRGRREAGRRLEEDLRHHPERHPQGIHRAEGIHLSAGAVDAAGDRHLRVRLEVHAEVQHHFHQRLPHSRGRFDRAAGAGVHDLRRRRVRRVGAPSRSRCRRVRSAAQLLLQRAQRLLRRNRQVPRGPQDLVSPDERPLRREEPAHLAACASTRRRPASR